MLRLAAGAALALAGACATVPPASTLPETRVAPAGWPVHRDRLLDLDDWTINGQAAGHDDGRHSWTATFHWSQYRDAYAVSLFGPLGQGAVQLQGDRDGGELRLADHKTYSSPDVERLLYRQVGWRIPVRALRYWARGVPVPNVPRHFAFDKHGRLAWLEQLGWRVEYLHYMPVDQLELPQRLDVSRRQLRVKLSIDSWTLSGR